MGYVWKVTPLATPRVAHRCPKCGAMAEFYSSDKFRVNANKRNIDVWLVYKCVKCDTTWNLTILSRVNAATIAPDIYYSYEKNDKELAWKCAFDAALMRLNAAQANWDDVEYDVEGEIVNFADEDVDVTITSDYPIPAKLSAITAKMTGLSKSRLKALSEEGRLTVTNDKDFAKARLGAGATLRYLAKSGVSV